MEMRESERGLVCSLISYLELMDLEIVILSAHLNTVEVA